jgi:hypothetical protein
MTKKTVLTSFPLQILETQRSFIHASNEIDAVTFRVRVALLYYTEMKRLICFLSTNSFRV